MSDVHDNRTLTPVQIPGSDVPIQTDGKSLAALRPIVEFFGLAYSSQLQKLRSKTWATVSNFNTVGADGKAREMVGIDRRTLGMWLATLDENRVAEDRRPDLRAYQSEAADTLDAYFNRGGAINPRATEHQINAVIFQARAQMELCQSARGLIQPDHLEAKARVVLARGLGEHAELDAERRPLYTSTYIAEKKLGSKRTKSVLSVFSKRVKKAYTELHGTEPGLYPLDLSNGQVRNVCAYTEADRPLLDRVWNEHYAPADVTCLELPVQVLP